MNSNVRQSEGLVVDEARRTAARKRNLRQIFTGVAFLAPNILGFLAFTLFPLVFSMILAFTNWDIRFHNMFKDIPLKFVGFDNFAQLFHEPDFLKYLGNTLFLMMGIPLGMAGSLGAALLLVKDTRGGKKVWAAVGAGAVFTVAVLMLCISGGGASAMTLILTGLFSLFLLGGVAGGVSVYRTLFYIPNFTAGVAVYILWKKMYSDLGPLKNALDPPLDSIGKFVIRHDPDMFEIWGAGTLVLLLSVIVFLFVRRMFRLWRDGDAGYGATGLSTTLMLIPCVVACRFGKTRECFFYIPLAVAAVSIIWQVVKCVRYGQDFKAQTWKGAGDNFMAGAATMVLLFVLLGLALACGNLPVLSADGLESPQWLTSYKWAKPAIMIMSFWMAVGSNNMILYIAGLSNIPPELYEAADIDGASSFQRFWNITWPQLAPITFFIFIMAVIGGLQGGFEMARSMTKGGPAGATTTLSYFIYTQGFETGRFGSASGVAWALFAMVLVVTLLNWKFGSKYVND